MPRLQRRTTLPKNSLVLLLKKAGKHLRRRQGEESAWGKMGQGEKAREKACSGSLGHLPARPSSCVSGISAEFKQGLGFIQGLCWFECGILPHRLMCFNTRSPAGGGV